MDQIKTLKALSTDQDIKIQDVCRGMGQAAKELPPDWKCYTQAEVERIVSKILNSYNRRRMNDFETNLLMVLKQLTEAIVELKETIAEIREVIKPLKQDEFFLISDSIGIASPGLVANNGNLL